MQALTWLCWAQVSLGSPLFAYIQNTSEQAPAELRNARQAEGALAELHHNLGILDARIVEVGNLVHDAWTLVDGDVCSVLGWGLYMAKIDAAPYKHLSAWLARANQRPAAVKLHSQMQQ